MNSGLRPALCRSRRACTVAANRVGCHANRLDRFRVPSTNRLGRPVRSGDRLVPVGTDWLLGTHESKLRRFQGFGPSLGAEQGGQAGTDFVFHANLEPIQTYTINARLAGPPKHSDTHEALKSRRSVKSSNCNTNHGRKWDRLHIGGLDFSNASFSLHRLPRCGIVTPFPLCRSGFHAFRHLQSTGADEG
jgi:hypothetical protein